MAQEVERKKNWAVYILFIVAVIAGILAFVDAGRYMGWIPINATIPGLGEISFVNPDASWFAALMSALLGAIWFLVAYWLWTLNPSGWMFVVVISVINMIFLALAILGRTTFSQVLPALLMNALALILALLPSTKSAFLPAKPSAEDGQAAKASAVSAAAANAADATQASDAQVPVVDAAVVEAAETDAPVMQTTEEENAAADTPDLDAAVEAAETDAPVVRTAEVENIETDASVVDTAVKAAEADDPVASAEAVGAGAQNLKVIEGIGPKISATLEAAGINNVAELASTPVDELRAILKNAGVSANPTTWPKQAAIAAAGEMDDLQVYQDKLEGGREV